MARMSPWVIAGIGCLGVAALGVVGIGGVGLLVSKSVTEEMNKPVDKEALLKQLDLPLYPKAELDVPLTQKMRAGTIVATKWAKLEMTAATFTHSASQTEVLDWYKKTLTEKGYVLKAEGQKKASTQQFVDKDYLVTVDVTPTLLMLTRMKSPVK